MRANDDGPPGLYKMGTVSRRTGFSQAVLRAWERRHAILEPRRGPGGHRLYTDDDLRVLARVRALLDGGLSIGEVAGIGRDALLASARAPARASAPDAPSAAALLSEDGAMTTARARVVCAAIAMDEATLRAALDEAFALFSPGAAVDGVIVPAAHAIGEEWLAGRCSVAAEHLASGQMVHRLRRLLEAATARDAGAPRAVCACLPEEQHELGALVAGYHLARADWRVTYLGPCLPFEDLDRAVDVLAPSAILLSVSRAEPLVAHRQAALAAVRRHARALPVFIGGRGAAAAAGELEEAGARIWPEGEPLHGLPDELDGAHRPRR